MQLRMSKRQSPTIVNSFQNYPHPHDDTILTINLSAVSVVIHKLLFTYTWINIHLMRNMVLRETVSFFFPESPDVSPRDHTLNVLLYI